MYLWLLLGAIVLIVALVVFTRPRAAALHEGMTVDADTLQAQRQTLQMEGERRYNDLARLQNPQTTPAASDVNAALAGVVPIPTSARASLLSLIGTSGGLSAADDGSNKAGQPQEQTGVLQDKINFCESLTTVDCNMLDDPRMAECGFCHRDGIDSKGKAHRGGMYISPDDQIRAAEANNRQRESFVYEFGLAQPPRAEYTPTVGTCRPQNFTLVKEQCVARELAMQCQSAGAATATNNCGQCFGAAPAGATGLLFMGDNKLNPFTAYLYVSHPGYYPDNTGRSLTVTLPDGSIIGISPASTPSALSPQRIPLTLKETDTLTIRINGMPAVWCAWLSDPSGKRSVSLDIGVQGTSPVDGIMIVGDKNSGPVKAAIGTDLSIFQTMFNIAVPNTVLWYGRRDELVPPAYIQAVYGTGHPGSGLPNVDVTSLLQQGIGGNGVTVSVSPSILIDAAQPDPAPGATKYIWAATDRAPQTFDMLAGDGTMLNCAALGKPVAITFQMPATLVNPPLRDDQMDCPTGPIITTEIGAGLMGAHSCFKADGSFNPTQYCLQELFQAAGGTPQGTDFPNTDAKAAALVVNNSLDQTVAQLNKRANIALYGVDLNGAEATFAEFKDASLRMLGTTPKNPCDGPNAASGPHTPECLDYLWRTSGSPEVDNSPLLSLPDYRYCTAAGLGAPLMADGSTPNAANVAQANALGSVSAIRSSYQSLYTRARNDPDFDTQAAAARACFGTNIQPPFVNTTDAPPLNPTEWQCFSPQMDQQPEVFGVTPNGGYTVAPSDAEGVCSTYGARLASAGDLATAQAAGADWCSTGWVLGDNQARYPVTTTFTGGCGNGNAGVMTWTPPANTAGVTCYGVKPPQGAADILPFAPGVWNQPQTVAPGATLSFSQGTGNNIQYMRSQNGQIIISPVGPVPNPAPDSQMAQDATFLIVAANNGDSTLVSLQSKYASGFFVRQQNYKGLLAPQDTTSSFAADSSFRVVPALNGDPKQISFQSYTYPDYYLTVDPNNSPQVNLLQVTAGSSLAAAASWVIHTPTDGSSAAPAATQTFTPYLEMNGTVVCPANADYSACATYPDMATCNTAAAALQNQQRPAVMFPPSDMAAQIDQYFAARI